MSAKQFIRPEIIFVFIRVHSWLKTFRHYGRRATKSVSIGNYQQPSFSRPEAMKDRRIAERLFVIGMFQRESLQFLRRRRQRDHIAVDAFVGQIKLVSI